MKPIFGHFIFSLKLFETLTFHLCTVYKIKIGRLVFDPLIYEKALIGGFKRLTSGNRNHESSSNNSSL